MDAEDEKEIDKWVFEFILRRLNNPGVCLKKLVSTMRLQEDNDSSSRLKKSAVLHDIWDRLIDATVDEKILDDLELLEKLLLQEGCVILESLKSAYCWVAVECTVKYMLAMDVTEGLYLDVLERIWVERLASLKQRKSNLVTGDLIKWEADLRSAVEDFELYQRIRETNTRYTAVSHLCESVCEQWALLGCSSLESVANEIFQGKNRDDIGNDRENLNDIRNEEDEQRGSDIDDGDPLEDEGVVEVENEQHGTDNQQEEIFEEADGKRNNGRVAGELKECLVGMVELINGTTLVASKVGKGASHNTAVAVGDPARGNQVNEGQAHNEGPSENISDWGSESEGKSSARVRSYRPTHNPSNVSPVRNGRPPQARNADRRRQKKNWSLEEVEALREGVKNFGRAWKDIKNANPGVFEGRSEVDLKDKWRNLVGR